MDREGYLKGWRDNRSGETILLAEEKELTPIAFSAIHMMNPEVFDLFPRVERFPLMPFYLQVAGKYPVFLYRHDGDECMDMGKVESYQRA